MITISLHERVATVSLASPATANALSPGVFAELTEAIDGLQSPSSGVDALVLTGTGNVFSSGADLDVLSTIEAADLSAAISHSLLPLRRALGGGRLPTIAAVNGPAVGGAVGLALLCDVVVACRSASFAFVFARLGLVPDSGLTQTLPRLVGDAKARAWLMSAAVVTADEAAAAGMIHASLPDADFPEAVRTLARRLADLPAGTPALLRETLAAGESNDAEAQIRLEADLQAARVVSDQFRQAMARRTSHRRSG